MNNPMITIPLADYNDLVEAANFLNHLHTNGVDNWEGYTSPPDDEDEDYEDE